MALPWTHSEGAVQCGEARTSYLTKPLLWPLCVLQATLNACHAIQEHTRAALGKPHATHGELVA